MNAPVDVLAVDGLIDRVAQAIRNEPGMPDETPWGRLSDDRKRGWRGDAERALAVVNDYLTAEPVSASYKSEPSGKSGELTVAVEVVSGVEGPSLYVNDYRVAGNKPWGGGSTLHSFQVDVREIGTALARVTPMTPEQQAEQAGVRG